MTAYPTGVVLSLLRAHLASLPDPLDPDAQVGSKVPPDLLDHLPFVAARATPGGRTAGPSPQRTRFATPVQIDVWASSVRAATAVADACLDALQGAHESQTRTTDGHLAAVTNISGPTEFSEPDRADGVARVLVTATLTVRPPAAVTP